MAWSSVFTQTNALISRARMSLIIRQMLLSYVGVVSTGWERTGQMLCIVDTSLSVLMTLRMCLRELCCLFTVWI